MVTQWADDQSCDPPRRERLARSRGPPDGPGPQHCPGGEKLGPVLEEPAPAGPEEQAIVVDAMGGDNGPAVVVAGAAAAAATLRAPVILAGRAAELRALVAEHGEVAGLLRVAPAEDTIAMDEGALASWRRPRSSVAVACQLVRRGQAAAVVSAGSTGGVVATARLRLRSVPGLLRPGPGGRAADPAAAHVPPRRGRDRRPQAGDASPVRAAGGGLRADRAQRSPIRGWGCSPSAPSRARATS